MNVQAFSPIGDCQKVNATDANQTVTMTAATNSPNMHVRVLNEATVTGKVLFGGSSVNALTDTTAQRILGESERVLAWPPGATTVAYVLDEAAATGVMSFQLGVGV